MLLTVAAAAEWPDGPATELAASLRRNPRLRLCLPTGDTPAPFYERLVGLNRQGQAPFSEGTILLLDEYVGLPASDPARCDNRLRRELLDRLAGGAPTFHSIDVDELSAQAAAEVHDAVAAEGVDLAIVGLGLNGHVGFNEPGSSADAPTRVVDLAPESQTASTERYGASATPRRGITLGIKRLLAADELWLLVTGEAKSEVLRRTLEGPESTDCPASFLRRHPRLHVFADEPAAALLTAR